MSLGILDFALVFNVSIFMKYGSLTLQFTINEHTTELLLFSILMIEDTMAVQLIILKVTFINQSCKVWVLVVAEVLFSKASLVSV